MNRRLRTALVVDDDAPFRTTLQGALRCRGLVARTAATVAEAAVALEDEPVDLVLVDYRLPGEDGLAAVSRFRRLRPESVIAMLTGHGDIPLAVSAVREGADAFFTKPVDVDRLLTECDGLADRRRASPALAPSGAGVLKLDELERQAILAALKQSDGGVAAAARLLGIDRRTLQRKLKKLG